MSEYWKISGQKFKFPTGSKVGATGNPGAVQFEIRPGGWILYTTPEGTRRRMMLHEFRGRLGASVEGKLHFGQIQTERRDGGAGTDGAGGGDSDLISQFPGKVRKILVSADESVAEGTPLVLVEAMKMEFTIKSPRAAKVARILVSEGQQISPGDRFLELK